VPAEQRVLDAFRELGLPVFWTNWAKKLKDGWFGALDRFYGPTGIGTKEQPMYLYGDRAEGSETIEQLAPTSALEKSREIKSIHINKFADRDVQGNEILMPLLDDLSIDTIVITGSWSDVCVLFTAIDAVDRYDLDVIVVSDAIATGTLGHEASLFILKQGAAKVAALDPRRHRTLDRGHGSTAHSTAQSHDPDGDSAADRTVAHPRYARQRCRASRRARSHHRAAHTTTLGPHHPWALHDGR
jgi:nicotinamidase-related amidase